MNEVDLVIAQSQQSALAVNKVLKNTYLLLSVTLAFSAVTATLSMNAPVPQSLGVSDRRLRFSVCDACTGPESLGVTDYFRVYRVYWLWDRPTSRISDGQSEWQ